MSPYKIGPRGFHGPLCGSACECRTTSLTSVIPIKRKQTVNEHDFETQPPSLPLQPLATGLQIAIDHVKAMPPVTPLKRRLEQFNLTIPTNEQTARVIRDLDAGELDTSPAKKLRTIPVVATEDEELDRNEIVIPSSHLSEHTLTPIVSSSEDMTRMMKRHLKPAASLSADHKRRTRRCSQRSRPLHPDSALT